MNSAIFSICADIGSLAIVSRDKTRPAAKQSTVPALCQKSCRHPKHSGFELPHDGKRTLANVAVVSLVQRKRHSCGTPPRGTRMIAWNNDPAPPKIPVTEQGVAAKLKIATWDRPCVSRRPTIGNRRQWQLPFAWPRGESCEGLPRS